MTFQFGNFRDFWLNGKLPRWRGWFSVKWKRFGFFQSLYLEPRGKKSLNITLSGASFPNTDAPRRFIFPNPLHHFQSKLNKAQLTCNFLTIKIHYFSCFVSFFWHTMHANACLGTSHFEQFTLNVPLRIRIPICLRLTISWPKILIHLMFFSNLY